MSKSKETYNKKEIEKRKLQKKKEKQARADDRKANAKKANSLEDMLAYVDENGNLSSTPPDPSKRKQINEDDILLGARKSEEANPTDLIREGRVTFFNTSKGYGFIKDLKSQESIFVHSNGLLHPIKDNDKVTFETERGPKGLNAINVKIA